jgi:hypothetical protein
VTGTRVRGQSEWTPQITDTTTGSHTVSMSACSQAKIARLVYNGGANATITDITGGVDGQLLIVEVSSNFTLTINHTGGHIKLSGGTQNLTVNGTIAFLNIAGIYYQVGAITTNS